MKSKKRNNKILSFLGSGSEIRILLIIIVLGIFISIASKYFLTFNNLINLIESISILSILSFAVTFVLLIGELDMSIGSTMAIAAITTNVMLNANIPFFIALLGGLGSGFLVGLINGTMSEWFGFPSLIVTLAMMSVLRGIIYLLTGSAPLPPYKSDAYFFMSNGKIFNLIPFPVIIMIVILIIISFMLFKTKFGRTIIMVGANRKAANISGVDTRKIHFVMFIICSAVASIAGVLLGSKLKSVFPEFGMGYELRAITAAVIGGVSLFGGKGSFVGSFLGAVLIGLIFNIIDLMKFDPYWQYVVIGVIVLIAVISDKLISDISMRRRVTS